MSLYVKDLATTNNFSSIITAFSEIVVPRPANEIAMGSIQGHQFR